MDKTPEQLFEENLGWAAMLARNVHRKIPPSFDLCDLEQVARIELWRRAQIYDPVKNDNFRGYAYLPVRGACLMSVRRRAFLHATGEQLDENLVDGQALPDQMIQQREEDGYRRQMLALFQLIKSLPIDQAYLVRRVYLNGITPEVVAATWGVPKARVSSRLSAAVRALKQAASNPAPAAPKARSGDRLIFGSHKARAV